VVHFSLVCEIININTTITGMLKAKTSEKTLDIKVEINM
jgi:hypothetical protein